MKLRIFVLVSLVLVQQASATDRGRTLTMPASAQPGTGVYVAGSIQKVCQVTGDTDLEFHEPTASLTKTRYGLVRADHGRRKELNARLHDHRVVGVPRRHDVVKRRGSIHRIARREAGDEIRRIIPARVG